MGTAEFEGAYRKMKISGLDWSLLKRLFPYVKKNTFLFIITLFVMLTTDVLAVLHPYLVKIGIDRYIGNSDYQGLVRIAMILAAVFLGNFIFQVIFNYVIAYLGQNFLYNMRMDVLAKVLALQNSFFDKTPTGAVMTNITNDVEAIREFISNGIITILGDFLKLGFIIIVMLLINIKLALLTFITIPGFILVTVFFRRNIRNGYRGVRESNSLINTALVETLTGIKEITLFNNKGPSKDKFSGYNNRYLKSFLKVVHTFAIFFASFEVISFLGFVIILLFTHYTIGIEVMVGEVFAFFAYLNMFYRPLRQVAEKFNSFQSAMAAAERIFKLLDTEVTIKDPPSPALGKGAPPLSGNADRKGEVVFENVSFSYEENNPIIKGLSFRIMPGEKVAVVGHTGAGKSTLINLLNRFYDIQSGKISVNGTDIHDYSLKKLRGGITTVPQDFFLFGGSLADNISLHAESINREMIETAAGAVMADEFIRELPGGYDEELLEEGKSLSTGQKQLLSFARAFVTDPDILVIDEATSSIDSGTEKLIEKALDRLLENRTALIIAHRLSTIRHVDRILVLHKGELVEEGSHNALVEKGGIYAQLYRMQSLETSEMLEQHP